MKQLLKQLISDQALRRWRIQRLRAHYILRYGLGYLWPRLVTARSILGYPPIHVPVEGPVELHLLTCKRDILPACWSLYSWFHFSGRRDPLCIHDDGSLDGTCIRRLSLLFPGARIITRAESDRELNLFLKDHPKCWSYRQSSKLALKVFDFCYYARAPRIAIMDSDQAFFARPDAFLRALNTPVDGPTRTVFAHDFQNAYALPRWKAKLATGIDLPDRLNSGLGLVYRDLLDLGFIESFLDLPEVWEKRMWAEQTLWALLGTRCGLDFLGPEYQVALPGQQGLDGLTMKHYVGTSHRLFFVEAVPCLCKRLCS